MTTAATKTETGEDVGPRETEGDKQSITRKPEEGGENQTQTDREVPSGVTWEEAAGAAEDKRQKRKRSRPERRPGSGARNPGGA